MFATILPAAGRSSRFGSESKLLASLAGEPVIRRAVGAFLARDDVAALVVAAPSNDFSELEEAMGPAAKDPRVKWCRGGRCRAESVLHALREVPSDFTWVAIHDAARPLVSGALIDRVLAAAMDHGAAVPALPVHLTIKQATGPMPARVERTVPRQCLWAMQTPQVMRRQDLFAAFENCPIPLEQITDDAQLLELVGREVWLVEGEERNLKITTRVDLQIVEMFLNPAAPPFPPSPSGRGLG